MLPEATRSQGQTQTESIAGECRLSGDGQSTRTKTLGFNVYKLFTSQILDLTVSTLL